MLTKRLLRGRMMNGHFPRGRSSHRRVDSLCILCQRLYFHILCAVGADLFLPPSSHLNKQDADVLMSDQPWLLGAK